MEPRGLATAVFTLALLAVSCTSAPPSAPGSVSPPSPAPTASGQPTTDPSEKKEVRLVKTARVPLANTVAALEHGDLAAARVAWAPYDGIWNGVETYVNFRSLPTYQDIEQNWQAKITEAFDAPHADAQTRLPMARSMIAKYDEAIQTSQNGPAISPIFDAVADLRIARAPLRGVPSALTANNMTKAAASFAEFTQRWGGVAAEAKIRSAEAENEVEQGIAAVNSALRQTSAVAATVTPLVSRVQNRVN